MSKTYKTTADFDEAFLEHSRDISGLKILPFDSIHPKDKNLDWIPKTVDENGNECYDRKPIKLAIFGLGRIGTIHIEKVLQNPMVQLCYCIEDSNERINYMDLVNGLTNRGVKFMSSNEIDKVLADKELDAVMVCTPT